MGFKEHNDPGWYKLINDLGVKAEKEPKSVLDTLCVKFRTGVLDYRFNEKPKKSKPLDTVEY